MNFRILHTADWHLDAKFLDEQRPILNWLIHETEGLFPDLIVIPGDIWNARQALNSDSAVGLAIESLLALAKTAPVVIVKGNNEHDNPGSISWLSDLKGDHPILAVEDPTTVWLNLDEDRFDPDDGHVMIHLVPYPTKAFVASRLAEAVGVDGTSEAAVAILDAYFKILGAQSLQHRERHPEGFVLGVGHFNVGGSVLANGQTLVSQDIMIPKGFLSDARTDYWALGHIHKAQDFALTDGRARYSGTFFHKDFGELDRKTITVVDMSSGNIQPKTDIMTLPTPSIPVFLVDANVQGTTIVSDVGAGWKDTKLRVRLHGTKEALASIDDAQVEARFPGSRSLTVERIPTVERDIRSKTIVDRRRFADQVFDWLEATGKTTDHPNLVRQFAEQTERNTQGENQS